ncbi:MAG: hypothetical protein K6F54_05090 [Lachnospiraceae bacterium]|nr:hypothetical protein [Lachnospiraceae bacterium]
MKYFMHKRYLTIALMMALVMLTVSGCEWIPTPADNDPKPVTEDQDTSQEETTDSGFVMPESESGQGFKPSEETTSSDADDPGRELSRSEISEIEEDFNSLKYNGFLSTEFATPSDIWWDEVFYNGAGIESQTTDYAEVERSYLKKTGDPELFGDLDYISTADINDFVQETTGESYGSMKHKLDWLYLKDLDVYTHQHGDTNFRPIELSSGIVNDGLYHVYYEAPLGDDVADKRFEVVFDKNDDGYVFVSNLWAPECGREEGMEAIYDSLIEKYAKAVDARLDADGLRDENISSFCTIEYNSDEDPMDVIGYYRDDLDGDGIDELLFGANHTEYIMPVYEAYTIKDGSWNRLFMSYDDSVYYLAKDGTFYYQEHIVDEGDRLSHCEMQGAYKFVTAIDMVRVLYDGTYEYSTDYFWKDVQPISEKEYIEYIDDANDMYVNIKYTPLSTVDIGNTGSASNSKSSYTNDELCEMALDYYENETGYRPTISEVDSEDGKTVTIHLYDIVDDHTATSAWYDIDRVTGKGEDGIFGDKVDLTEFAPR